MFSDREKVNDGGMVITPELFIQDGMNLSGHVTVRWEDVQTGETGICHSKSNLIVNKGRDVLVRLLKGHADPPGTTYHIDAIRLGTQGHTGNDVNNPAKPLATDTSLTDTTNVYTKAIASGDSTITETPHNAINFNITIGTLEGNASGNPPPAKTYTEAGLFCNSSTPANAILFARQTFASVVKTNLRRLTFTWTISWS